MSIVKRTELNRPLTHAEVDSNFEYVDVTEWAPRTYLKGQKIYTLGNNGIYPIYICLVNHDETSYTLGAFNEYGLVNGVNTKLWLKTGADTFTGVITGVTVNATYQAYTGSTITGTTLNLKGHNIADSHLNFINSIRNTYSAYTGITTTGANIHFFGHNTAQDSLNIDLVPMINSNYKSYSGSSLSGAILSLQGHNVSNASYDLTNIIKSNYKAITGSTLTGTTLTLNGHGVSNVSYDLSNIFNNGLTVAITGVTIGLGQLVFNSHGQPTQSVDISNPVGDIYRAFTGATLVGT